MGKKTKKTKWRTLEIALPMQGKHYRENGTSAHLQWDDGWRTSSNKYRCGGGGCDRTIKTSAKLNPCAQNSSSEENQLAKALAEDEYTKITTPRQDVLFKKSYLTKRKTLVHADAAEKVGIDLCTDDAPIGGVGVGGFRQNRVSNYGEEFCDYANMTTDSGSGGGEGDTSSMTGPHPHPQLVCAPSQQYMDASSAAAAAAAAAAAMYYGGGYEIYDPYTGNVTAVVVGAASSNPGAATCRPILTSVPLQSLQWFNPLPSTSEWCGRADGDGDGDGDCDCGGDESSGGDVIYTQQDDITVPATGNDAGASKPSYSSDSTNVSEPASESSCTTESTTLTTGGDDPLYASQSFVYPAAAAAAVAAGYVIGTPLYNLADDDGNLRYYSPASPMLSGSEIATIRRKKKRKRRRRFGEAAEDSESGIDENCQDGLSGNEYVFNYAYDDEYDHEREDDSKSNKDVHLIANANSTKFQRNDELRDSHTALQDQLDHDPHRCYHTRSTLSHASINAPPFVPAKRAFADAMQMRPYANRMPECNSSDRRYRYNKPSITMEKYVAGLGSIESTSSSNAPTATSPARNRNESPNDSPPSSGNSDSGIGSPGNEDCVSADGRHFAKTTKAAAAAAADRSKSICHTGDDISFSVSVAATTADSATIASAADANKAPDGPPINVNVDTLVQVDGRDDKLKKVPSLQQPHSKKEERSLEPDVTAVVAITNKNAGKQRRDEGKKENVEGDDDDGKLNRKKRSKKSTKILNQLQIERMTVAVGNSSQDCNSGDYDCRANVLGVDDCQTASGSPPLKCKSDSETKCTRDERDKNGVSQENDSFHPESPSTHCLSSSSFEEPIFIQRSVENENDIKNNRVSFYRDQFAHDKEKKLLAKARDVNDSVVTSSPPHLISVREIGDGALVEAEAKDKTDTRLECVAAVARTIVDEIVQQAELQLRRRSTSTEKCDKLSLPLTRAVTNWMNESGGLPAVVVPMSKNVDELSGSRVTTKTSGSKTSKSVETFNCVVC